MEFLFESFMRSEFSPHVHKLILNAVREHEARPELELKSFVLNCFEVKLDFVNQVAVLEDEFDVSPSGTLQLPLDEFLRRLG